MILTTYSVKGRAHVSTLCLKSKDDEPSLLRHVFPNLAWILITEVILFPPGQHFVPPRTTICAPWKDLVSHSESPLNWHERSRKRGRKNPNPGLGRASVTSRRDHRFSECSAGPAGMR